MTTQLSYSKIEKELLPKFRKEISTSESTEDVKKFFSYTMQDLLTRVFSGKAKLVYGDVSLQCELEPPFVLSTTVRELEEYASIWNNSDLPQVLSRFATIAAHRHIHLQKHPEKTEAKIRM